ncbi:hypothetical protein [Falsirhodobacter sp. 1013]|uniref:hypothetical protein n=1 Tax=Falsirhodobacter sp. 1013 TaxID=3417566 RepID=UPI003EB9BC51
MTESPKALEAEVEANRANVEQTLDALRGKATMQGVMSDVTRYIGVEDARGTLEAAGRQVTANPLAFGLLAAGLACLATGVTRRNPHAAYAQRPYDGMNSGVVGEDDGPSMTQKAQGYVGTVRDGASHYAGSVRDGASHYAGTVREGASHYASAASEALHGARDSVYGGYRDARYRASNLTQRAGDQMVQQPLLFGAIALVAGAVLGAALPKSQAENRLLGPSHDRLTETAKDVASDLVDRAKSAAEAGLSAATDVAKDEGLMPGGDKTVAERLQHVAEAATKEASTTFTDTKHS